VSMPYKDPERKRQWEREHRKERNERRRAKRLRLQAPLCQGKPLPDRVLAEQPSSAWETVKRIGAFALVVGISLFTVCAGVSGSGFVTPVGSGEA
jgi:hypothetical protein